MKKLLRLIGVRTCILMLLTLPLLPSTGLGGWKAWESWRTASEMHRLSTVAGLAPKISELVHELQKERGKSAGFVSAAGRGQAARKVADQRPATDQRLQAVNQTLDGFDAAAYGNVFVTKLGKARTALSKLDGERASVSALRHTTADMARFYTGTINELLGLIEVMESLSQEAHVTTAIAGYLSLLKAKERAGLERAMGAAGFGAGAFSSELHRKLINLVGQQDAFIATFASQATSDQQSFYRQKLSGTAVSEVERLRKIAIESPFTNDLQGVSGATWFEATTRRIDLMKTVEDRLSEDLLALVEDLRESAQSGYLMITGFLVTMITALTAFGFLIARNISGPISEIVATIEAYKPGDLLIKRWVYRKSTAPLPAWTR